MANVFTDDRASPMTSRDWAEQAACIGVDPDIMCPPGDINQEAYGRAKTICADCPVSEPCLDEALNRSKHADVGVWGGTTPNERVALRRKLGMVTHGTTTAYTHYRCRCQDCRDVMAEAKRRSERRKIERAIARVEGRKVA